MTPEEYLGLDAVGAAEGVRRGEITSLELTEAAIERIEALNPRINAVVECDFERAREAAVRTDPQQPLAGVPFLAKDMNIEVQGLRLTSSCRWLAQLPAAREDAPLAARWRRAGLSILGRTNTPEFAGDFVTEPTWRGATSNPWDLSRTPGGSSGGAAAAVACGMVAIAHGTDSGGSIRVPAAACGLVGLKPSRGWVPVGPHQDELAGGLDCEHVLSRSVRDTALMLDLTQGTAPGSRYVLSPPAVPFVSALGHSPRPLKIGVQVKTPAGVYPDAEVAAAVDSTAAALTAAGHHLVEFHYPASAAQVGGPAALIWMTATAEEVAYYRGIIGRAPQRDEMEALTWACVELAERSGAVDYAGARRTLAGASRDMALAWRDIDILLLPTLASPAITTGSIDGRTDGFNLQRWNEDSYGFAPYTELFNVTGQPAISLPLAQSRGGLPIGVQLVARPGEDATLLNLAAWFERAQPWSGRLAALQRRFLLPQAS